MRKLFFYSGRPRSLESAVDHHGIAELRVILGVVNANAHVLAIYAHADRTPANVRITISARSTANGKGSMVIPDACGRIPIT